MQHVDEGQLHAWLDGELPAAGPDGARALEDHLAGCAACRDRAEDARRMIEDASAILGGADPGEVARPMPRAATPLPRPARRMPWVPLGWAASVLLALGIGWMARPSGPEQVAIDTLPAQRAGTRSAPLPMAPEPVALEPASVTQSAPAPSAPSSATSDAAPRTMATRVAPEDASGAAQSSVAMKQPAPPPPPAPVAAAPPVPAPVLARREAAAEDFTGRGVPTATAERASAPVERVARRAVAEPAPPRAATVTVRGQVTDERGHGLAGVNVRAMALTTTTGADGSYTLALPAEQVALDEPVRVSVSRVGMATQTRTVDVDAASAPLDFTLNANTLNLEGLVVTGESTPARGRTYANDPIWRGVDRREAERRLGSRLVTVPRLPLLGIEVRQEDGLASVRVLQSLENGDILSLVQRRAPRTRVAPRTATELSEQAGNARFRIQKNGLVVEASAPMPTDSLRTLLKPLF